MTNKERATMLNALKALVKLAAADCDAESAAVAIADILISDCDNSVDDAPSLAEELLNEGVDFYFQRRKPELTHNLIERALHLRRIVRESKGSAVIDIFEWKIFDDAAYHFNMD